MKMTNGNAKINRSCQVMADPRLYVSSEVESDLTCEAIGYAVCRFIIHHAEIFRDLVAESYYMRVEKRRKRRQFWFVLPAVVMDLPGSWVKFRCTVTPVGVNVDRVLIRKEYPAGR